MLRYFRELHDYLARRFRKKKEGDVVIRVYITDYILTSLLIFMIAFASIPAYCLPVYFYIFEQMESNKSHLDFAKVVSFS